MQIQSPRNVSSQPGPSGLQPALSPFSPGEIIQAEVAEADQGQVVLRLPQGDLLRAGQRTMEPLEAGDMVLLQATQEGGGSASRLELLSVNGQPLKAGVPLSEYALLRMQVAPSRANLAIAAALAEMGVPARPQTFERIGELSAGFPALETDAALLLAASSLPLEPGAVEAFSQWLQHPARTADLAALAEDLAAQDGQAAPMLEAAVRQMEGAAPQAKPLAERPPVPEGLPQGLSPALASKLEQSGIWQELVEQFPTLSEKDVQGILLQLTADLPPETAGAEQSLIHHALLSLCAHLSQGQPQHPHAAEQAAKAQPGGPWAQGPEGPLAPVPPGAGPEPAPAPQAGPPLRGGLRGLFAALLERPAEEQGQALREAAVKLGTKLRNLTGALKAQEGPEAARLKPVLELGHTLASEIRMGGELGNFLCVPLPVILREAPQDASLYVLKRNGGDNRVDESNVTVAICLETQNLGSVDTLLRVERNEITLQFRVESDQARSFFQAYLAQAAGLSFPPPYRFQSASVVLRDAPITPLNAGRVLQRAFGSPALKMLDISV